MNHEAQSLPLRQTLERIRWRLGLTDADYAGIMGADLGAWQKIKREGHDVSIRMLMNLAERLNVGFDSLVEGTYDPVAMERQFFGARLTLPERYERAAYSKARAPAAIVKYVDKRYGTENKFLMLRSLQLKESMLEDLDRPVNLRLSIDLTEWIHRRIRSEDALSEMGQQMTKDQLAQQALPRSVRDRYEWYLQEFVTRSLEKSYSWEIASYGEDFVTIRGYPHPELLEAIPEDIQGNIKPCRVRKGMLMAVAQLGESRPVAAEHPVCIALGDKHCEFRITFD